ncbi:helix-turn-helix domain-containing protein [Streptomyces sp. R41]|uniref:Helix-turn-helix domain-containing protein n=1 Tax=Streptomyces sp. R41 TaxID=3238632 RepID=A0AB39R8I1_9ACTN
MKQSPERAVVPRPPALAPLSDELGKKERAFAEHFRGLREGAGMISADLAEGLGVDPTQLSRYLSGQSLPEPQLLTRFHQLLADPDAESFVQESARESRTLLYAAAQGWRGCWPTRESTFLSWDDEPCRGV